MSLTAILLIAHGSRQPLANDDLYQLATRIAERGEYPIVEPCFLELAEPDIATGGARCVAHRCDVRAGLRHFPAGGVFAIPRHALAHRVFEQREPRRIHAHVHVRSAQENKTPGKRRAKPAAHYATPVFDGGCSRAVQQK